MEKIKKIMQFFLKICRVLKDFTLKICSKIQWKEIAAAFVMAALVGFIILPSVCSSVQNGQRNKCSSRMYLLLTHLSEHLLDDSEEWQEMALKNGGEEAISILAEEIENEDNWEINASDYYFELKGNELTARCKIHKDLTERSILLANIDTETEKENNALGWNVNTEREIENIEILGDDALIIDAGNAGKFCLAAWKWEDYVKEAQDYDGDNLIFDASIVLYDDKYYYYPDGFRIRKNAENTHPFKYAEDLDNSAEGAYCIPFDTSSVSIGRFSSNNKNGSLMVEDNEIYIWQTQPSRELSKGWIRVYCKYRKL